MFLRGAGSWHGTGDDWHTGLAVGQRQQNSIPNITGVFGGHSYNGVNGAFSSGNGSHYADNGGETVRQIIFDTSRSNSSYGRRIDVAPENYAVQYFIKY